MSDENLIKIPQPRLAEWLMEPMRANRSTYWKVALAAVFINIFGLLTSLFTMTVYDRVVPNNATSSLVALTLGLAIVIIFDFILKMLRAYFVDHAGAQIDRDIGEAVFDRMLAMRLELKKGSTGALAGHDARARGAARLLRLGDAHRGRRRALHHPHPDHGRGDRRPGRVRARDHGAAGHPGRLAHPSGARAAVGADDGRGPAEAVGAGRGDRRAGDGQDRPARRRLLSRRWLKAVEQHSDSSLRQRLVATIGVTFATSAGTISYAGVVIVGVDLIAERELTMGGLIACSILAGRAIAPLAQISQLLSRLTSTRTAYRQINEMMKMPPEGPEGEALKLSRGRGQDRVPQCRLQLSRARRSGRSTGSASRSSRASMSPCSAGSAPASRPSPA